MNILKQILSILIGIVVLTLIVAWMSGAFRPKTYPSVVAAETDQAPADARIVPVMMARRPVYEEAAGTVVAARRTAISSRIMATIRDIKVRAGDSVKEGDTLIVLDDRDLKSRVEQAGKSIEAAQARIKVADSERARRRNLFKTKVVAQSELDQAERDYEVAKADLERAQQAEEEARVALTYGGIKTPVSGRVVDRLAEPGDTAAPGQPLLQLYDPSALQLEAAVRETLASRLRVGDTLHARIDALGETVEAKIAEIVPQAEVGSRVFRVKVTVPPDPRLYTGVFGRLIIPVGERVMVTIPAAAVETIGQNRYATVVDEKGALSRRLITVGESVGQDTLEILSGLSSDERVQVGKQ